MHSVEVELSKVLISYRIICIVNLSSVLYFLV